MFELGILKDFLLPSKFSRFGYVVVVFNLLGEVVLVAVAGALGSREQDKFQCKFSSDKNRQYLLEQCYQNYVSEYNSPLPLWGFEFLELCLVLAVCLIYYCLVNSTSARIFPYLVDVEYLDEERPPCNTRSWQVFRLYFVQLFGRLLIATLFTVLQNTVFFPFIFPQEFLCGPITEEPQKNPNNSKTEYKPTSLFPTECLNSLAVEKTVVCVCVHFVAKYYCFLLVFGEIIYLVFRAFRSSDFIVDTEFRAKYFFNRSPSIDRARDCLKKLTLQQTRSVLLIPLEERRLIDDIFVDLTIQMKKPDGEFFTIHRYDELYLPIDGIACDARKVLVVGPPGSGKSLLCQKLLRDWGKKTSPNRFDFAFLFKFSWFSSQATCVMSLRELLNRGVPSEGIIEDVFPQLLAHPERILLVFDGFDDLKDCESCTENREAGFENSSTAEIPLSALFLKLLQNKLLRGATLLTTSRSDAITSYVASLFERTVEIKDFTEENVHQYVDNYYTDSSEAIRIKEEISSDSDLLSLSCMPVFFRVPGLFWTFSESTIELSLLKMRERKQRFCTVYIYFF